jgi:hypothetical protein
VSVIDYADRLELLKAFERIAWGKDRPTPLEALAAVVPCYKAALAEITPNRLLAKLAHEGELNPDYLSGIHLPLARLRTAPAPAARAAVSALDEWAAMYGFQDDWILEAGHETARAAAAEPGAALAWRLPDAITEPPAFPIEALSGESEREHRKRQHARLDAALERYYQHIQWGQKERRAAAAHALWAARFFFFGWTAQEIANRERTARGRTRRGVYQAAVDFARRVSLNYPPCNPPRGEVKR